MNFFKKIFSPYKLNEVFTPNTVAKVTYVKRELLEGDLKKYISLPGKQIVIYGHSGGGKTTLIRNILNKEKINYVRTHCENCTTFNELLLNAFDSLNRFYIQEKTSSSTYNINSELKSDYKLISAKISESLSTTDGIKQIRIVPPQLTPQKLAQFLGEIKSVWIIEDFHKVRKDEKQRIADVIKIFIDQANDYPDVKIVCIGAVGTARELIELDDNLRNRIAEMFVPLLTDNEIKSIINKGSNSLNISIPEQLMDKVIYYSNNLGSLAHQICYDICYHNDIFKTKLFRDYINTGDFKIAVESYVRKNSDSFLKLYDQIISERAGWKILKTFDYTEKEHLSFEEIKLGIRDNETISDEDLILILDKFSLSEYSEIIRYDAVSKKYSISTPFFRAFLKMKLALEKTELKERRKKKQTKKQNGYNIEDSHDFILNEDFISQYYQYLDSYIVKRLQMEKDIHEKIRDKIIRIK
ncbi:AAA family ATPase [Chryseobacterium indologenes]|uniref:AAA family ATPase n=1 Tax=Chryseobacterium indologenes TaxID=253 RepID=UPI00405981D0